MKSLPLTVPLFARLEIAFGEWLSALGYAEATAYYAPLYAREFMAYLERRGIADLRAVDAEVVATHFALLASRDHKRRGGGLSRSYLLKHRQALRLFARYLSESGQGGFNVPTEAKRKASLLSEREVTVLTRAEVEALYAACEDDELGLRDRAMLALFYGCGLRRNEGVRLDLSDLLLHRGMVYVRHGKNYKERYVPLAEGVARDLAAYLEGGRPLLARPGEKAVLVSRRGGRIDGQSLLRRIQGLQERAAHEAPSGEALWITEKAVGLHTLRHSIATHLLLSGMALEEIALFLGHRSLESTQLYTHLAQGMEAEEQRGRGTVHVVDGVFSNGPSAEA